MRLQGWDTRVIDLLQCIKEFIKETDYDIQYDHEQAQMHIWNLLNDPETAIFVNYDSNAIRGFAIVHKDREFQKQYFGFLSKFYVLPTERGTNTARELMQEITQWFDSNDCAYSFGTATANIKQDKLFINLLLKFGYRMVGTALIRNKK